MIGPLSFLGNDNRAPLGHDTWQWSSPGHRRFKFALLREPEGYRLKNVRF